MFTPRRVVALSALLVLLFGDSPVRADQDETAISLTSGFAGLSVPKHAALGAAVGADYEYGLTDLLWLRASAGVSPLYDRDAAAPAYVGFSEVGITYVIDVLRYVPHVDLGLGGMLVRANDIDEPLVPLLSIGAGLDLLTSRTRSLGFFARFASFLGGSSFYQVGVRTTWRSGFF